MPVVGASWVGSALDTLKAPMRRITAKAAVRIAALIIAPYPTNSSLTGPNLSLGLILLIWRANRAVGNACNRIAAKEC